MVKLSNNGVKSLPPMSLKELKEMDHLIQSFESKGLGKITISVEEICKGSLM